MGYYYIRYDQWLRRIYRSPLYKKYQLGTTVFSALASGLLTGKVCYFRQANNHFLMLDAV